MRPILRFTAITITLMFLGTLCINSQAQERCCGQYHRGGAAGLIGGSSNQAPSEHTLGNNYTPSFQNSQQARVNYVHDYRWSPNSSKVTSSNRTHPMNYRRQFLGRPTVRQSGLSGKPGQPGQNLRTSEKKVESPPTNPPTQ